MEHIKYFVFLFFSPNRLCDEAYRTDSITNEDVKKQQKERVFRIRNEIFKSFVVVLAVSFLAKLSSLLFWVSPAILIVISVFILLWATLGLLSWEIQSWGGKSLPERINIVWYKALYIIGTYFAFLSIMIGK